MVLNEGKHDGRSRAGMVRSQVAFLGLALWLVIAAVQGFAAESNAVANRAPDVSAGVSAGTNAIQNPHDDFLVWIGPGSFLMGSQDGEVDRSIWEGPQTRVVLTEGFWMCKYETTQKQYTDIMGFNPSYYRGDMQRPVERVSWADATNYCAKFTQLEKDAGRLPEGYVYRLPTEAEWEYACRAGTTTRFSYGDDPSYRHLGEYTWYGGSSDASTHPVGQKKPNPWGLYDLHGNVWEWCADWWYFRLPGGSVKDPLGPRTGQQRVIRGGRAYDSLTSAYRSAYRYKADPESRMSEINIGFRIVLGRPLSKP